ncbi:DinB family protein [Niabella beijingensis]|uniref:DinB family protein n=1 Tax=Niabella beijingensis TaxID=2872700 RepID=UPI001CBFACEC|nr:DinB family protein [Niabella beijingensis]MBZ4189602.1 DinB family protein [Niabella beijingensis]
MLTIPESLSAFNNSIQLWIGYLDAYTLQQLQQRPAPVSWSLGQVYMHLISDTTFYMEQMEAALATDEHVSSEMTPAATAMFTSNAFPDQRLENPFNDINLPQPLSKEQLFRELTAIREKVIQLFADADHRGGKTLHPGFQYFSAAEWLQFAAMHLQHHLRQKERIDAVIAAT